MHCVRYHEMKFAYEYVCFHLRVHNAFKLVIVNWFLNVARRRLKFQESQDAKAEKYVSNVFLNCVRYHEMKFAYEFVCLHLRVHNAFKSEIVNWFLNVARRRLKVQESQDAKADKYVSNVFWIGFDIYKWILNFIVTWQLN